MQQTFSAEKEARLHFAQVRGDLEVHGWDKREISLEWDERSGYPVQEGNLLQLIGSASDIKAWVPYDAEVSVEGLGGDLAAQDIRRIELKDIRGQVDLRDIGVDANLDYIGEAISLMDIGGDLTVQKASSLRARRKLGDDVRLQDVRLVDIEAVRADLEMRQVDMASIGNVGADLRVTGVGEALRCGNVGGDCQIEGSEGAEINLGNVGGDLRIEGAILVHVANAGSDAELRNVRDSVEVGNVGGDGTLSNIGGDLTVGQIGADARLLDLGGSMRVGGVGGDLELQSAFAPESKTHVHVGGDASVVLPVATNLSLQATVGGSISGPSLNFEHHGNLVRLVYGEGLAQLNLSVGGDLRLRGGDTPRVHSASMPWGEFSQEMAELGQGMARLGRELGQEFTEMFSDMGRANFEHVSRKVEEQIRRARQKAEQHARKAEERARRAEERAQRYARERGRRRGDRMYVRVNEREWQMNPERFNDLVNRAQEAAMDGVAGAMEAVERAVGNLRMQYPTRPYAPPTPPTPPAPPAAPQVPVAPEPPAPVDTSIPPYPSMPASQPEQGQGGDEDEGPNLEAEREAILRMIAEGRITPEEGDMLLEGLGQ
jgi:hypothetical protein